MDFRGIGDGARLPFCLRLAPCLILVRTKCVQVSRVHRGPVLDCSLSVYTEVDIGASGCPLALGSTGSEFLLGNRLSTRWVYGGRKTFSSGQKTCDGYVLFCYHVTAGDASQST